MHEHFREFLDLFPSKSAGENSWTVNVGDIQNFDLSAKNPNRAKQEASKSSAELLAEIRADNARINTLLEELPALGLKY